MGRCPLSCAVSDQSPFGLQWNNNNKKAKGVQFPWKLGKRCNIVCRKRRTVNGKFSSLLRSQLLFSLQCKLGPNIFCHIKDANSQFYFLSRTTVHKSFRICSKTSDIYLSMNPKHTFEKKNNLGFLLSASLQKVKAAQKSSPVYVQCFRLVDSQSIGRCAHCKWELNLQENLLLKHIRW